jgi:hypothetical protein
MRTIEFLDAVGMNSSCSLFNSQLCMSAEKLQVAEKKKQMMRSHTQIQILGRAVLGPLRIL